MNFSSVDITTVVVVLLVSVLLFLLLRPVVLWYYKINERNELLAKQNELLQEIKEQMILEWREKQ